MAEYFQTPGPDYTPGPYQFFDVPIPAVSSPVPAVPSPDPAVSSPDPAASSSDLFPQVLSDIQILQSEFDELASQVVATQGYMNTNTYDILSSVVAGSSKPYYVAYRYDDDAYNVYLYLCEDYEVNGRDVSLVDTVFVQVYRYRYSSSYSWQYLYSAQEVGDVDLSLGVNAMVYTNIFSNYPILGSKLNTENAFSGDSLFYILIFIFGFFVARIFRRG